MKSKQIKTINGLNIEQVISINQKDKTFFHPLQPNMFFYTSKHGYYQAFQTLQETTSAIQRRQPCALNSGNQSK